MNLAKPKRIVRTSEKGWLESVALAYQQKTPVTIIDDAETGIDPRIDSLFQMGRRARLSRAEIIAVCVALGMSLAGIGMVLLAFFDPEPTTKLGLLIAGGATLVLTGGFSALYTLTKQRPPKVSIGRKGIEISWD